MSGGGGGTTVNETNVSGLADSQFNTLNAGQGQIRSDISALGNSANQQFNTLGSKVDTGFNTVNSNLSQAGSKIDAMSNNVNSGFNNLGGKVDTMGSQITSKLGDVSTNVNNQFAGMNTALNNTANTLNQNLNSGFAGVKDQATQNFNTLNSNQTKGFGDLTTAVNTGFANNTANVNSKFAEQGNAINTGFTNQDALIKAFQQATLSGQDNIKGLVEKVGGNLDSYYGNLSAADADQTSRLGTLQSGLDTFQRNFERADTLATQQRARLQDSVAGGFNAVREDMSTSQGAADVQSQATQNQLRNIEQSVQDNTQNMTTNFSRVAKELAVGFNDGTRESMVARNDFIGRLDAIRSVLTDQSVQIDEGLRKQYGDIVTSFDGQGRLIARSIDNQGNQISRALDAQGNLLMATFDGQGQRVNQSAYNLDASMKALDMFRNMAGTNTNMTASNNTGLMSPYSMTR